MAKPSRGNLEDLRRELIETQPDMDPEKMSEADLLNYWEAREYVRQSPEFKRTKEAMENPLWMTSGGLTPTSVKVSLVITLGCLFGCVRNILQGFTMGDLVFWVAVWFTGTLACFLFFRRAS